MAKQWDSGIHDQQVNKVNEAVTFNGTFNSAPDVFVTCYAAIGKGTGASNITTTGFDCYSENVGDAGWLARETGFDGASSSSSSTSSSSLSSSSLSSSSSSSSLSSSSSSSSSSLSSSSRSSSSSSSSLSISSSSSSTTPATKVWGKSIGTQEDHQNTFTGNWTTSGGWFPSGSGDTESFNVSGSGCGQVSISQDWYLGSFEAIIFTNKYDTGSGALPIIHYKTHANRTGLSGATWTLYNGVSFTSLGWVRLKITHS